jgi:putative peptidoglycan lipid II flippase
MKTPMRIAIVALVTTQLLNLLLVPRLDHAGLALSIGLGALVNAGLLLMGLLRRRTYQPSPGWAVFLLQVVAASALLAEFLAWVSMQFPRLQWRADKLLRIGALAATMAAAGVLYFAALAATGLKLRQFVTR